MELCRALLDVTESTADCNNPHNTESVHPDRFYWKTGGEGGKSFKLGTSEERRSVTSDKQRVTK